MSREFYLNAVLPALLVAVGFAAAWLQGREVKRRDRKQHHHHPDPCRDE